MKNKKESAPKIKNVKRKEKPHVEDYFDIHSTYFNHNGLGKSCLMDALLFNMTKEIKNEK